MFEGIGKFPGSATYSIQLYPNIPPKQIPCHPLPIHLTESLKQEIDKMLKAGILKPVHEATLWINCFVLVEGKGKLGGLKLHICLDPTNLNKADNKIALPFQNTRGHCTFGCRIMYNDYV